MKRQREYVPVRHSYYSDSNSESELSDFSRRILEKKRKRLRQISTSPPKKRSRFLGKFTEPSSSSSDSEDKTKDDDDDYLEEPSESMFVEKVLVSESDHTFKKRKLREQAEIPPAEAEQEINDDEATKEFAQLCEDFLYQEDDDPQLYYQPVKVTTNPNTGAKTTHFPKNFYGPDGLAMYEMNHLCEQDRIKYRLRGKESKLFSQYNGKQSQSYTDEAQHAKVPYPDEDTLKYLESQYMANVTSPKPYITPHTIDYLRNKYARYLFRKPFPLPEKFPFVFCPHSHSYIYNEKGLQNVITGTTVDGNSVTLRVGGFLPYCYSEIPEKLFEGRSPTQVKQVLSSFLQQLNQAVASYAEKNQKYLYNKVEDKVFISINPEIKRHISTKNFQGKKTKPFLKITALHPQLIRPLRAFLQRPYGRQPGDDTENTPPCHSWLSEEFYGQYGFGHFGTVYDAHVDYTVRFLVDNGLTAAGNWFVSNQWGVQVVPNDSRLSNSNLELFVNYKDLAAASDKHNRDFPPIRVDCKFDIEVETFRLFPTVEENRITQISMRTRFGPLGGAKPGDLENTVNTPMPPDKYIRDKNSVVNICLCLEKTDAAEDYDVHYFDDERKLLITWMELMVALQPDFIAGHYSDKFDFDFLLRRAKELGLFAFPYFARYFRRPATNNAQDKNTEKKGDDRPETHIPGMVVWDFYKFISDYTFEKTKSLDALAEKHLKHKKLEVEYTTIGKMMKVLAGRNSLAEYCNRDVLLLEELDDKLTGLQELHQMSNLCNVPIQLLGDRATTFRMLGLWHFFTERYYNIAFPKSIASRPDPDSGIPEPPGAGTLLKATHPHLRQDHHLSDVFYLTPSPDLFIKVIKGKKYGGGCVLEPVRGLNRIFESTLDYRSLYPSIMIAFNLGHITMVPAGMQDMFCTLFRLDRKRDLWDEPVFLLTPDGWTTRPYRDPDNKPSYIRPHVMISLISYLEDYVMNERGKAKKSMREYRQLAKDEKDPVMKAIYLTLAGNFSVFQLVLKLVGNGMYGALGLPGGAFSNRPIAETITNVGRQTIEKTRYTCTKNVRKSKGWSVNVAIGYGDTDSVMPLLMDAGPETPIYDKEERVTMKARKFVFAECQKMCDMINALLPKGMKLQMEKTALESVHVTKKCYAMLKTEDCEKDSPYYVHANGLSYVRRGGCKLQRDLCKSIIDALLLDKSLEKAIRCVRIAVRRVLRKELTYEEVLIRSSLSKKTDAYVGSKPPQVVMAEKIKKRTGLELKAGDRVYFVVVPGPPKAKISDKVESPEYMSKHGVEYCIHYYLEVVLKEARKLLAPLVDQSTFAERYVFSDELRILDGQPGGKDLVAKKKADRKKQDDKLVNSVIMGEREIKLDDSERTLSALPEKYQQNLPEETWNWAGLDPDEEVPHISTYKAPWIKNQEDITKLAKEIQASLHENIQNNDPADAGDFVDDDNDNEENVIPNIPLESISESVIYTHRKQQIPGYTGSEEEKEEEAAARQQEKVTEEMTACLFTKAFSREKKENYITLEQVEKALGVPENERLSGYTRVIKQSHLPSNSIFKKAAREKPQCKGCGLHVDVKYMTLCRRCEREGGYEHVRIEYEESLKGKVRELDQQRKIAEEVCRECSLKTFRNAPQHIRDVYIKDCSKHLCSNWPLKNNLPTKYKEALTQWKQCQIYKKQLAEVSDEEEVDAGLIDIEDGFYFKKSEEELEARRRQNAATAPAKRRTRKVGVRSNKKPTPKSTAKPTKSLDYFFMRTNI